MILSKNPQINILLSMDGLDLVKNLIHSKRKDRVNPIDVVAWQPFWYGKMPNAD